MLNEENLYYCPICGEGFERDIPFCTSCGGKVEKRNSKLQPDDNSVLPAETTRVQIIENSNDNISQETVLQDYSDNALSAFDGLENWEAKPSRDTYQKVKKAVSVFVRGMQQALENEKQLHINELTEMENIYKKEVAEVQKELLTIPNHKAQLEFQNLIRYINTNWYSPEGLKASTKEAIATYDRTFEGGLVSALLKFMDKNKLSRFEVLEQELSILEDEVENAINTATNSAKELKKSTEEYNRKVFEICRQEITEKYKNNVTIKENEYKNKIERMAVKYEAYFERYFNDTKIQSLQAEAKSLLKTDANFTCAQRIPLLMFMGYRKFKLKAKNEPFYPEVINILKKISPSFVSAEEQVIIVSLPYFHTLDEGYSIYVDCIDPASSQNQKFIKAYVLKMFMSFPAGQARPLLLDNDSTTTLSMFGNIGESSQRGIITRPWVSEDDITAETKKVAAERSKLSISYGDDIKSRLERELIYFIAGRNFPKGFSLEALNHLSNIFLAGSKNGFFGLLQANASETKIKTDDHEWSNGISTIQKNSLHLIEYTHGYYINDDSSADRDCLEFDCIENAMLNSKEIISTIIAGVSAYSRQTEKFEYLFSKDAGNIEGTDANNMNTWFRGSADNRFEVPIGISGASTVQKFVIHEIAQHALVSGVTGSGKSSLLRTIITSSMMKYTPENLNLYLVDFKEGVEFEPFSNYRLPWIKVIALDTEREFALNILKDLEKEFKYRATIMKKESVSHISQVKSEKFPRIIFVFDEVQELLRTNDAITEEAVTILARLVSEGRAMNINIILTSQDFTNCNGLERLKANMVIRIAFKGSPNSAKTIMGDDFSVEQLEQGGSGYAAINSASGAKGKTNFFQCGYLDLNELKNMLSKLSMTMQHQECSTRIMSTLVSQDRNNIFNRLICNNEIDYVDSQNDLKPYNLIVGDALDMSKNRSILLSKKSGDNLLVVGDNENVAKSIFSLSILSLLYDELSSKAERIDNELIRIIDLSDEYESNSDYFEFLASSFDKQISRSILVNFETMINDTYDLLLSRKRGTANSTERLFLMFFGIDNAMTLYQDMYGTEDEEINTAQKLKTIIENGPEFGINSIIWSHSLDGFKRVLDKIVLGKSITKRMFFGDNKNDCEHLTGKSPTPGVIDYSAVLYKDLNNVSASIFRPYILPDRDWVESIAQVYKKLEKGQV